MPIYLQLNSITHDHRMPFACCCFFLFSSLSCLVFRLQKTKHTYNVEYIDNRKPISPSRHLYFMNQQQDNKHTMQICIKTNMKFCPTERRTGNNLAKHIKYGFMRCCHHRCIFSRFTLKTIRRRVKRARYIGHIDMSGQMKCQPRISRVSVCSPRCISIFALVLAKRVHKENNH